MTTKIINFKDCRTNLSKLWKDAKANNVRYLVTIHSRPVLEIKAITDENSDIWFVIDDTNQQRMPIKWDKIKMWNNWKELLKHVKKIRNEWGK